MASVIKILESTNFGKTNKISAASGRGSDDAFASQLKSARDIETQTCKHRQTPQESGALTRAKKNCDTDASSSKSLPSNPIKNQVSKAETSQKSPEATSEDSGVMVTSDISDVDIPRDPSDITSILLESIVVDVDAPQIEASTTFSDIALPLDDANADVVLGDMLKLYGEERSDTRLDQNEAFLDDIGLGEINMKAQARDGADGEIENDGVVDSDIEAIAPEAFEGGRISDDASVTMEKIDKISAEGADITTDIFDGISGEQIVAVPNWDREEIENTNLSTQEEKAELNEDLMLYGAAANILPVQREVSATRSHAFLEKENKSALGDIILTEEQIQLFDNSEDPREEPSSILADMTKEEVSLDVASNIVTAKDRRGAGTTLDNASKHDSGDSLAQADIGLFGNVAIGATETLDGDYGADVMLDEATHTAGKADYVVGGTTLRDLSTGNIKFAEVMNGREMMQTPAEQISISVREAIASGKQTMTISLTPENLGAVEIKLDISNGTVKDIRITAHKMETLDAIIKDSVILEQTVREILKSEADLSFSYRHDDSNSGGFAQGKDSEKASSHYEKTYIAVSNNTISRRENIVTEDMVDVSI